MARGLGLTLLLVLLVQTARAEDAPAAADEAQPLSRIAFGSCCKQPLPQPIWGTILASKPELWIWSGDMVYADTLYMIEGDHVLKSINFGASWSTLSLVSTESWFKNLDVSAGGDIIVVDAFTAYHSNDGGASWATVLQVVPFSGSFFEEVRYAPSA